MLSLNGYGIPCFNSAKTIDWKYDCYISVFVCGDPRLYGLRLDACYISGVLPVEAKC